MTGFSILRTLSSRILECGCLTGIYEKYNGDVIELLDSRSERCHDDRHTPGLILSPTVKPPSHAA